MKVPSKKQLVFICLVIVISVLVAPLIAKNFSTEEIYYEKIGKIKGITYYIPSAAPEISGADVSPEVTIIRFEDGDILYLHGIHDLDRGATYRIVYQEGGILDLRGGAEWGGKFISAVTIEKIDSK